MEKEELSNILHPWSNAMFQCGTRTFRTIEGAYQAHRKGFHPGYEDLNGGQAWARGARRRLEHDYEALRVVVQTRYAEVALFRATVQAHAGPFKVWHPEPCIAKALEVLYAQLRKGRVTVQNQLPLCVA